MAESVSTIEYYQKFAPEYDGLSRSCGWVSPRVLFGLVHEFVSPKESLLDIGIGTGQSAELFHKFGLDIWGIDGSKEMLDICKKKDFAKGLKCADLNKERIPYRRKFNHAISCGVFYFFRDLEPFFKEAKRLLKPSGIFSFTTEDSAKGNIETYVNCNNSIVSERIADNAGVRIFTHPPDYILSSANKHNFELLEQLKFLAYHSPTEKRDVWFRNYVFRKDAD